MSATPTAAGLQAAVTRYFAAVNADRFDELATLFVPHAEFVAPVVGTLRGPGAIATYVASAVQAFADHHDEPVAVHVAAPVVTVELRFTGMLSSGGHIAFAALDLFTFAPDGRIERIVNWYDAVTVRRDVAAAKG